MRCGTSGYRPATRQPAPPSRPSWPLRTIWSRSWWWLRNRRDPSRQKRRPHGRRFPLQITELSSRRLGRVLLGLDLPREQPAEIGQRRVRADGEQLVVRIGIEHLLLRLDDVLVLVKTLFQRVAQRQRDIRVVDVEIVQVV